jgi:hypothetical protein
MAAFMGQDAHQVAAFIYDCLLARVVGVDPVDLDDDVSVSTGADSDCFLSVVSDGSLSDSDLAEDFASCSSDDYADMDSNPIPDSATSVQPHEPLVGS